MRLAVAPSGFLIAFAALLQACGGGSGSDGDAGSGPRLSVSSTSVSAAATPGEAAPLRNVTLSVSDPPDDGDLYVDGTYTDSGIEIVNFTPASPTQGSLDIQFRNPGSKQNGTYTDSISIRVCTDQQCATQVRGSPVTIATSYVVSGTGTSSASIDRNSIEIIHDTNDTFNPVETVRVTHTPAPASPVYIGFSHTASGIYAAGYQNVTGESTDVNIYFKSSQQLGPGTFNDTVQVSVCYDTSCVRQLQGSPFTVSTTFTVGAGPEPGVPPLAVQSRVVLTHNIVDAEFSKSLGKIVMVGTYPANRLYVYDVATGTEQQQSLNKAPTAVSVSPDGLTAAIGHDALITMVDLTTVGQPGAPAPTVLNVSTDVLDVILAGNGYVYALPRHDQWEDVHTVRIATNTETLGTGFLYAGTLGRLHPSGDYIYTADNGLSPSDIQKWDVRPGTASMLYDSPYHGDFAMCGDLWFSENGATIYTRCGNTFRSSTDQAQDMVYTGALQLTDSGTFAPYVIRYVSQSAAINETALLEFDYYQCVIAPQNGPCYEHLAIYESSFLNRLAVYSLEPLTVNDTAYAQQGLFVFHDASGAHKYLLSKLVAMPNPDAEYYLSVIQ